MGIRQHDRPRGATHKDGHFVQEKSIFSPFIMDQGTYIISGGSYPMCPKLVQDPYEEVVITGAIRFRWDVLHPKEYNDDLFTIEKYDEDYAYAKPAKSTQKSHSTVQTQVSNPEKVYIQAHKQEYEIVDAGNGLYKIYLPGKKQCLKWNGKDQAVTVANDSQNDHSLEWVFDKDNGPYEAYRQFFVQDMQPNPDGIKVFPHFGLLPLNNNSNDRWSKFWERINNINNATQGVAVYKVIFLGRHGESLSNLLAKLERAKNQDVDQFKKDVDMRDPDLSQQGTLDAMNVHAMWEAETKANIGLPQISYCSPLYRALLTNTITFGTEVYYDSNQAPEITTIIVENCREKYQNAKSEYRRSKSTIHDIFPKFVFEDGFASDDPFWKDGKGKNETMKEVRARARDVLGKIFSTEGTFVSITAHAEFIEAFLRVVGRGPYSVTNGAVIPLVCKYTPSKNK